MDIRTIHRNCPLHTFETEGECDRTMMGICSDIAVNAGIPMAYITSRHTAVEFCKLLAKYCGFDNLEKLSKAPLCIVDGIKTTSIETSTEDIMLDILSTIRSLAARGCKLVILDGFVHATAPFAALAAELGISMSAVIIKNNQ